MVGIGDRWMRDPDTGKGGYVPSDMSYKEWKEIYIDKTSTMEKWKAKHVDFFAESDIIKTRGEGMYRKSSKGKAEPMPKKQYQKKEKAFKRQGGVFQYDEKTDAYLSSRKAEAITYDAKTVLFK